MILYKTVPGKKSCLSRNCMVTKDVYNNAKKGFILNTPLAIFNMQMHRSKVLFMKTSQTLTPFHKTEDLSPRN